MLTYRQLLEKCNRKTLLDILYSKSLEDQFYKGGDPKEFEIKAQLNLEGYKQVIDAVLTKPVSEPKLSLVLSVGTDEQYDDKTFKPTGTLIHYVIVSFYNSRVEKLPENAPFEEGNKEQYHKFMGFGLNPWKDFVDADVVIDPSVVNHLGAETLFEKIAAEILWEQTFYGYSEVDTKEFVDMLKQRVEDIKSGKIKTKKLKSKKGDKYKVFVPEDLFAPTKKKRSNKKK